PIAPERVAILSSWGGHGHLVLGDPAGAEERMRQRFGANLFRQGKFPFSFGKLEVIARLMDVLTQHYDVPHLFDAWMGALARREALASTGMGRHFGLLHQFQYEGKVSTASP